MIEALLIEARLHAPALLVFAPAIAAGLVLIVPWARAARAALLIAAAVVAAVGIDFGLRAGAGFAFVHSVGIEAAPLAAGLRGDGLSGLAALHVSAGFLLAAAAATGLFQGAFDPAKQPLAAALLCLAASASLAAALSADLLTTAIALECAGLAGVAMTALASAQDRRALPAAMHQLVAVAVGGAMCLFAASLLREGAGASDVQSLNAALAAGRAEARLGAGLVLFLFGAGLIAAVAPLHSWGALAVSRAPAFVSLALVAMVLPAATYAFVRAGAVLAEARADLVSDMAMLALAGFGALALAIGAVQCLAAADVRRLAFGAWQSQLGAGLIGVAVGGYAQASAGFMQIQAAAIGAVAALAAAAFLARPSRASAPLAALDGLGRRAPLAGAAFTAGALSLVGAPLTLGFTAKLMLFGALLAHGWWWAAALIAGSALMLAFAFARALERVWLRPEAPASRGAPLRLAAWPALVGTGFATLALGIDAAPALALARAAATAITGIASP